MHARSATPPAPVSAQTAALILLLLLLAVVATGPRGIAAARGGGGGGGAERNTAAVPRKARLITSALASASAAAHRAPGRVAFALALPDGRVYGEGLDRTFASASLSKSLLAVTVLRSASWRHDAAALADTEQMLRWSDNAAASRTLGRVGGAAVRAAAQAAGMRSFHISGSWAEARVTARDFARLLLLAPRLVPRAERPLLRRWLAGVVPAQRWGIPAALRSTGAHVLFKGGWRTGLVHQAARVERHGHAVGLAVLTDHQDAGMSAGATTIERVTRALLGRGSGL